MIGAVGADYICESLKVNKNLKNIITRNCGITADTVARVRINRPSAPPWTPPLTPSSRSLA